MNSVTTIVITSCTFSGWRNCLAACKKPLRIVTHDVTHDVTENLEWTYGAEKHFSWSGDFNWGALANLAANGCTTDWLLFLHDDVEPPTDEQLETMLLAAEQSNCKIVFPAIDGISRSERQSLVLTGWSHATEYATDCCILIERSLFEKLDGFKTLIPGHSFDVPALQLIAFKQSYLSVIAHDVRIRHHNGESYSLKYSIEQRQRLMSLSARTIAQKVGIRTDFGRISEPRLVNRSNDPLDIELFSKYAMIGEIRFAVRGNESTRELIDVAANHSPSDNFRHEGILYRRYARGDRYVALDKSGEIKIGIYHALGFGDTFFVMKALRALKIALPECKITIFSDLERCNLFSRCLDVDSVVQCPWTAIEKSAFDIHRIGAFGVEYSARRICDYFGVPYDGQVPAFELTSSDVDDAKQLLKGSGYIEGIPLVGIQTEGGWPSKRWCFSPQFARQTVARGWQVCWIGTQRLPRFKIGDLVIDISSVNTIQIAAILSLCDVVVGFDSGGIHAAAAVGTPSVSLWGPHDPNGLLLDADIEDTIAIRKRIPWQDCGPDNCRSVTGGVSCPLRQGAPGADCLDEVSTAEVWRYVEEVTGVVAYQLK